MKHYYYGVKMKIRAIELRELNPNEIDLEDVLKERFSLQIMIILLKYGERGASLRKIMNFIGPSKYRSIKTSLEKLIEKGLVSFEIVKYSINDGYNYKLTKKGKRLLRNLELLIQSLINPEEDLEELTPF